MKRKPKARRWSAAAALDDEIAARMDAMADTEDGVPDRGTALLDILNTCPRGDTPAERTRWRKIATLAAARLKLENMREMLIAVAAEHGRQSEPDHETGDLIDMFNACWRRLSPAAQGEVFTEFREVIAAWPPPIDVLATDHGTIVTLEAQTDAGRDWFKEHLFHAMRLDKSVVVEHRYLGPILDGIDDAGLTVGRGPLAS